LYNIRTLEKSELKDFVELIANAYPGLLIDSDEKKKEQLNTFTETYDNNKTSIFMGAFKDDTLVGCMKFFDFEMNLLSKIIKVGGLGSVAVNLLHKKEKVAREMVKYFISHYRNKKTSMTILYPFRSDFYKKMGYGYGSGKRRYSIRPINIPNLKSKNNLKFITGTNIENLTEYYNSKVNSINGLLKKHPAEISSTLKYHHLTAVGYFKDNQLEGYLFYKFNKINPTNPFINEMVITEMLYDNSDVLQGFLAFLNSQADQIKRVVFEISDENFKYNFDNPSMELEDFISPLNHIYAFEGLSVMYRINDIKLLFEELKNHNFSNENIKLKLTVNDTFICENNKSFLINFKNGSPVLENDTTNFDVELQIDIGELASLITCSVDLITLYNYGKVSLSNSSYLERLSNVFSTAGKPICLTYF